MVPLTLAGTGAMVAVLRVSGSPDMKKHLEDLGFVPGTKLTVLSSREGDVIVSIKDSRLGITREMAEKIKVQQLNS